MIKIITVYNSLNPGSFLQASALYNVLQKKYKYVAFYDTKSRHPLKTASKKSLSFCKSLKIRIAFSQFFMGVKYIKCLKKYNIEKGINCDDIFVIGSDEIWNVARTTMSNYPIFWGEGLKQNRCISYAPSINNATYEELSSKKYVSNALKKIHNVSVRDTYSYDTLKKIYDRNIIQVCDPTVLIKLEEYKKIESKSKYENYIFVYIYPENISDEYVEEIINFSKKHNKRLISYHIYYDWCDDVVMGSPYDFLSLISNSYCVFTSTFHGTMLSTIYNKKIVVFGNKNMKVLELIRMLEMNISYDLRKNVSKILNDGYNIQSVNKKLKQMRVEGLKYLYESINSIE